MSNRMWCKSIGKFEVPPMPNEDFAYTDKRNKILAISDGAGGGGVFADKWAQYLCGHLPVNPICSFTDFDLWIDGIWEPFYNECEELAKTEGGLFLQKFYDEGSFATLAVIWKVGEKCHWITYGDSTVFMYRPKDDKLFSSLTELNDYNVPPYLINSKDPLNEAGFKCGSFDIHEQDIVLCASDALSHYILMLYYVTHRNLYYENVEKAVLANTKNSNCIRMALGQDIGLFSEQLSRLLKSSKRIDLFSKYIKSLLVKRLIVHDDYSIAVMEA